MSGGNRLMVLNTRERVVSDDHNRLQAFEARAAAEVMRRMLGMRDLTGTAMAKLGAGFVESGSYVNTAGNDVAAVGTPLRGDVFEGLTVLPQVGSLNLLVDPGCVGLDDPDGQAGSSDPAAPSADDSRYKIVVDPGIPTIAVLTIGAGSGGAARVDVVECQRTTVVLETDSRDQFDPSTGTIVPVTVTKVVEGRLVYRVRAGTPGDFTVTVVQGWLPLAVALVPNTATIVEDMLWWDVRPLVSDRVGGPLPGQSYLPSQPSPEAFADDQIHAGETRLGGYLQAPFGSYRAGGLMQSAASSLYVNLRAAANQAPGFAPAANALWHLYAVFPKSLPRWVRYAGAPLLPVGPSGILTVSATGPFSFDAPADSLALAAAAGSQIGGTHPAVHLCSGFVDGGSNVRGVVVDGERSRVSFLGTAASVSPATTSTSLDRYELVPNTHFPADARSVIVRIVTNIVATATDSVYWQQTVTVMPPGDTNAAHAIAVLGDAFFSAVSPGTLSGIAFEIEIPRPPRAATLGYASDQLHFNVNWGPSGGTPSRTGPSLKVVGWRLAKK